MAKENRKQLSSGQRNELITLLKARFEKNKDRHKGLEWNKIEAKLEGNAAKLWSLSGNDRIHCRFNSKL
jgi:hypothetical protein